MIDIQQYEDLPFRECFNSVKYIKCGYRRHYKSTYHKNDKVEPWKLVERISKHFIGKSFDDAFSYFCTKVPKYQQFHFLENFEPKRWKTNYWYVDENRNIQYKSSNVDKSIWFRSIDCEIEHIYEKLPKHKRTFWNDGNGKYIGYKVIKGLEIKFSSRNDPTFKKLQSEKRKAILKSKRDNRAAHLEKLRLYDLQVKLWRKNRTKYAQKNAQEKYSKKLTLK